MSLLDAKIEEFKKLLDRYWDRVENWATSDHSKLKKLVEYENKALDVQNELIEMFKREVLNNE